MFEIVVEDNEVEVIESNEKKVSFKKYPIEDDKIIYDLKLVLKRHFKENS